MSASDVRVPLCLGALALLAACAGAPDVPEPPDVSRLLSAYATPAGKVDPASASWLETAEAQLDLLGGGQADVVLTGIVETIMARVEEVSLPTSNEDLLPTRVDGVATLEVQCGNSPDEIATVAVAITDGKQSPLFWGTARGCPLWETAESRATYEGSFTMYRYPGAALLVRIEGTMTGLGMPIHLDFRLTSGRLETRIGTPTGDVIAARDGGYLVVRASNGAFRCETTQQKCRPEDP
jgi:hypothetical protein